MSYTYKFLSMIDNHEIQHDASLGSSPDEFTTAGETISTPNGKKFVPYVREFMSKRGTIYRDNDTVPWEDGGTIKGWYLPYGGISTDTALNLFVFLLESEEFIPLPDKRFPNLSPQIITTAKPGEETVPADIPDLSGMVLTGNGITGTIYSYTTIFDKFALIYPETPNKDVQAPTPQDQYTIWVNTKTNCTALAVYKHGITKSGSYDFSGAVYKPQFAKIPKKEWPVLLLRAIEGMSRSTHAELFTYMTAKELQGLGHESLKVVHNLIKDKVKQLEEVYSMLNEVITKKK